MVRLFLAALLCLAGAMPLQAQQEWPDLPYLQGSRQTAGPERDWAESASLNPDRSAAPSAVRAVRQSNVTVGTGRQSGSGRALPVPPAIQRNLISSRSADTCVHGYTYAGCPYGSFGSSYGSPYISGPEPLRLRPDGLGGYRFYTTDGEWGRIEPDALGGYRMTAAGGYSRYFSGHLPVNVGRRRQAESPERSNSIPLRHRTWEISP